LESFTAAAAWGEPALLGVMIVARVLFSSLCRRLAERPSIEWSRRIAFKPPAKSA